MATIMPLAKLMDVSIRELKSRLSEYLRRVQAGEPLYITARGRRVARVLPEPVGTAERARETLADLDAQPWVEPPTRPGKPKGASRPLKWPAGEKPLSAIVLEERA
jgi:prevent-host-death family protein